MSEGLRVVVLTCSDLGSETAAAISTLPVVEQLSVIRGRPRKPGSLVKRLKKAFHRHGPLGILGLIGRKLIRLAIPDRPTGDEPPKWSVFEVDRFEDEEGLALLRSLSPDIAVVDGTYILPASVFSLPSMGTINIHCGYLPDYKGAPPAFWEIFEGEASVGVTIHLVSEDLDGGDIVARKKFSLDPAPSGDPMAYADRVWRRTLRPAGLEMIREVLARAPREGLDGVPQEPAHGRTYRSPSFREVRELRRRVRARRRS